MLVVRSLSQRFFVSLVLVASGIISFVPSSGCSRSSRPQPINVVGVDRSDSTKIMRDNQVAALSAAYYNAAENWETVAFYAVDTQCECIFSPRVIESKDQLPKYVITKAQGKPGSTQRTRPALFWEQMAKDYATSSDRAIRILYLTDGDNDWATDKPRIEKAVNTLAQNKSVFVAIAGINPDQYESVKELFAGFDPRQSIIRTGHDRADLMKTLNELREKDLTK